MNDRLLSRPFVQLLIVQASFGYAFSTFSLLPKYLALVLGLASSEIGAVMGALGITAVCFVPLVGFAVDHLGRRGFLLTGATLIGVSSIGFMFATGSGAYLYALRLVQGAGFASFFVAGLTLAADLAPASRISQALGLFGVTNLIMNAIAPTVTEILASRYGWQPAFGVAAVLAVVAFALIFGLTIPESPTPSSPRTPYLALARRDTILRPSIAIGLTAVTFSALFVFHQPYALENGLENVSGFFIAYAIGAGIARIAFGDLADRRGHLRVARIAAVPYALGSLILLDIDLVRLALAGFTIGLSHGFLYPALNALVIAGSDRSERGAVMGIFLGAFNVGFAAGPPILGLVAERAGYPATFAVSAAFAGLAFLLLLWTSSPVPAPAHTAQALPREPQTSELQDSTCSKAGEVHS